MANRYQTPVLFAMEKNVVLLSAQITFDSGGGAALVPLNSKGHCFFGPYSEAFTGSVASGSSTITSVSSFQGLFTGQTVSGTGVVGTPTIGTISAATGSIVLSAPFGTAGSVSFLASGGSYILQYGTNQAQGRLDSYFKLLQLQHSFDMSTGSAIGTATQAQLAPAAPSMILVKNNTKVRTVPATATSASTDCSIIVQFGSGAGTSFVAATPAAGEGLRIWTAFGNSSSI